MAGTTTLGPLMFRAFHVPTLGTDSHLIFFISKNWTSNGILFTLLPMCPLEVEGIACLVFMGWIVPCLSPSLYISLVALVLLTQVSMQKMGLRLQTGRRAPDLYPMYLKYLLAISGSCM